MDNASHIILIAVGANLLLTAAIVIFAIKKFVPKPTVPSDRNMVQGNAFTAQRIPIATHPDGRVEKYMIHVTGDSRHEIATNMIQQELGDLRVITTDKLTFHVDADQAPQVMNFLISKQ